MCAACTKIVPNGFGTKLVTGMATKITDAWLRSVKGKPYNGKPELILRDGLGVRISPKGKITWVFRFTLKGKPVRMKLGEYPEVKISEAEKLKYEKAALVREGIDPRSKLLLNRKDEKPTTVTDMINYWYENHALPNLERPQPLMVMFERDVIPYVGDYPAESLELVDYVNVFKKANHRAGPKHSANLMARLKAVLSFAVRHGILKYNVISVLKKNDVGKPADYKVGKQEGRDIKLLWSYVDDLNINPSNKNLLRLMMIFACRGAELRLASKKEFDFEKMIWTVPKEHNKIRNKGGREIKRAIPEEACAILREQFSRYPNFKVVFPPVNKQVDRPMAANTLVNTGKVLADYAENKGLPRTTNHDMRRTARNFWESSGFNPKVSEVMLGHKVHTGVTKHYLDYDYLDEQREFYKLWTKFLTTSETIEKVTYLKAVNQ